MVVLDGLEGIYDLKGTGVLLRLPSLHTTRVKTKLLSFFVIRSPTLSLEFDSSTYNFGLNAIKLQMYNSDALTLCAGRK